jgi:excisionase family DNA binding protein
VSRSRILTHVLKNLSNWADLPNVNDWNAPPPTTLRDDSNGYLRAAQAADLLHVSPKTVSRWARDGKLAHVVTLGGHRRYRREDIELLANSLLVEVHPTNS